MQADHPLFSKLARALVLSDTEATAVRAIPVQSVTFKADEVISREGDRPSRSFLRGEGLTCISKVVAGGKRRILMLQSPGDASTFTPSTSSFWTATSGPSPTAVWTT